MSAIHPDEITSGRLSGSMPAEPPRRMDPVTLDGTIIDDPSVRPPLVLNNRSFTDVTNIVCGYAEQKPGGWWLPVFGVTNMLAGVATLMILYLIITGVGVLLPQARSEQELAARWWVPDAWPIGGGEVASAQLDAVEKKLGFSLGAAVRSFYQQANGLALVWGPKGECPRPVKGRPTMMYIEALGGARGAIYMPPVGDVFGVRGRAEFDYAQYMPGAPSHWGFDFPGNFYTPAFVRVGDGLQVRVGDDHGAAWDGPTVSFERYLENVLATWGSIDERAKQFVNGKGKPVATLPLAKLLA